MTSPSKRESTDPNKASGTGELALPPLSVISTKAIQPEIQALWETLSAKETVNVFANLFKLLWKLLLRLVTMLSVFLLAFAVVVVWLWGFGYQSGRKFREIFVTDNDELGGPQIINGLARLMLIPVTILATWVKHQVKVQFGRDFKVSLPDLESQVWPYSSNLASDTAKASGKNPATEQQATKTSTSR